MSSKINLSRKIQGSKIENQQNNDLDQKLTYQQLLNINHDLTKENMQLKNIGNRLGQELRSLHTQFQTKPRQQSPELYQAMRSHPTLHQFQHILMPLLDAYENKIQQFQHSFQQIHEEFFTLEKKFEDVCKQNEDLRQKLTDKTKELLEVYRDGSSSKIHSDFNQMILDQINQKQKCLVEENTKLERDYQRYKSEAERTKNQVTHLKESLQESRTKLRESNINEKKLTSEVQKLKQSVFSLEIKASDIQTQKKKLQQANERAQSQNIQLNRQKEMYKSSLQNLRKKIQSQSQVPVALDQNKEIEQLKTKISFLQAQQGPNDYPKRFSKLQKDYQTLLKEKNRLKEAFQSSKVREDSLNEAINNMKGEISKLDAQKSALEMNEERMKRSLQNLTQKSKKDILRLKKDKEIEMDTMQSQLRQKIEMKERKLSQVEDQLSKVKLQRDKLQKQNIINAKEPKTKSTKESERTIEKLRQKIAINEDIFKQQIQILQNDLSYLKKESESHKNECKQKTDQLKKLRAKHEQLERDHQEVTQTKSHLVEEFRRVRNQYQSNLKEKERVFQEKIREVKEIVQESDARRRNERERVQESAREYKRVLEDLKATYQARIRELESHQGGQSRYRIDSTPVGY